MDGSAIQDRRERDATDDLRSIPAIAAELRRHPFHPPPWLRSCHLQTVWGYYFRKLPAIQAEREKWETPDGDFLNIHRIAGEPGKPTALLLHGLEGSAQSNYIVGMMDALRRKGWSVLAMEHRTCGGELNRARRLYHSADTEDLAFVAGRLLELDPSARIHVAGFSLGGNQLLKWLGEEGEAIPAGVRSAAAVSPPYDLVSIAPHMERALGGVYARKFLQTLVPKALAKERQYPGCIDAEALRRVKSLQGYDTHATAPLHGFRDCWDYYERASCGRYLEGIRRRTLLISAYDDPFYPRAALPTDAGRQPWLIPLFTERGGHVGFVRGRRGDLRHWAEEQIVRFFELCERADAGEPTRASRRRRGRALFMSIGRAAAMAAARETPRSCSQSILRLSWERR